MAARSPRLAKLARPKLFDAVLRPRLYSLVDKAARRPIVWISAPPGAGKTTLVASHLESTGRRYLWYQCDAADADTATFVHYLRVAAEQLAGRGATHLPPFAAAPQQALGRFARGFARDLFAALPHPCAIVLDNFQDPRTTRRQRAALAEALEELPEGITVIVLSRAHPPPEFARLVASQRIARIDAAELRCTAAEAEEILGDTTLAASVLDKVREQSDGWVAALVLLREHLRRKGGDFDASIGEGREAIFQYFAGEILHRARPENRRVLMLAAVPPSITAADAVALTGHEDAPRLLDYLCRHQLFTERRRAEQPSYRFHALFRNFLLHELAARIPRDERLRATRQAAQLLADRGEIVDALGLYRDAGEWRAMRNLVHAHALEWARQGRSQALSDWIEALPSTMRDADPWLEYWVGRAWIFLQPLRGRPAVERAYDAFRRSGEVRGEALALSTIVTSYYYEWAEFAPLDRWLPELERLLGGTHAAELDAESELRARCAWLMAMLLRRPEDDHIAECARRLEALIDGERDLNLRVLAGATLFNFLNWTTYGESTAPLIARIEPILGHAEVSPLMQVQWRTHLAFWHYTQGRYPESTRARAKRARSPSATASRPISSTSTTPKPRR